MPAHPLDKIEHFLIHTIAVLFLFSSISAAFLGYGVYENSKKINSDGTITTTEVEAAGTGDSFSQTDWTGGVDTSSVYTVPWFLSGSWTKYDSATNVVEDEFNLWKMKATADGATLVSSVFDNGSLYRVDKTFGGSYEGTLEIRGGNSVSETKNASWQPRTTCLNTRYFQYRLTFPNTGDGVDTVIFATPTVKASGIVKDTNGNGISGATVTANNASVTTSYAPGLIPAAHAKGGGSGDPIPGYYQISWAYKTNLSNTISITASKSGYKSQTKTLTLNPATCSFESTINFALEKIASSSSSGSEDISVEVTTEVSVSTDEFQDTKLPKAFTAKGAETTDLSKVKDPKKVKEFTIHVPGKSKVVFKDTLNLSGESTVKALESLDKYLKMDKVGIVDLDSKTLKALNKKATIIMEGLKFVREPGVLVDGKEDKLEVANNFKYSKEKGEFTFDVRHFTAFWAVPKLILLSPTTSIIESADVNITGAISDGNAKVVGSFNGVKLANIDVNKKTGEFTIKKLTFKEGENTLKFSAESELGTVLPAEQKITYAPGGVVPGETNTPLYKNAFLYFGLAAILLALLLGYLVYRKRKRLEQIFDKLAHHENPPKASVTIPTSSQQ